MDAAKPIYSVITVVYNAVSQIERTIQSVLGQSYKNIEYIIIDGGSMDGTINVIRKYESSINKWVSEPDKGLYDAMNKGLALATGDYVCFLNAGDTFYNNHTLSDVTSGFLGISPDVIYGETMIIDENGKEIGLRRLKSPELLTWKSFCNGMLVCHQSIYIKRTIAKQYNPKYRIAADFEWVINALHEASNVHNTKLILTHFLDGGMNKKNIRHALIERFKIMTINYGFFPTLFRHTLIGVRFLYYFLKNKRF